MLYTKNMVLLYDEQTYIESQVRAMNFDGGSDE